MCVVLAVLTTPAFAASITPMPTAKASATPTAKASATPTPKATTKKPVVPKKPVVKKKVSVSPSPSPSWPPTGFRVSGEIYAKIPTALELIGIASNNKTLTAQLAQKVDGTAVCEKFSWGAVQLASISGCMWWEVTGKVVGETSATDKTIRTFGIIRTTVAQTGAKVITTVLLISQEPLALKHAVANISANCHHDIATEKIPSTTYSVVSN